MPSFEENINNIEKIIAKLEDNKISLEDLVKYYTEGLGLVKESYQILNEKNDLVVKKMTELGLEDFKEDNNKQEFEENL